MSVNPNSTNANATTSYFALAGSGGGGGSVSTINNLYTSTINFGSPVGGIITTYPALQSGPGGIIIGNSNGTDALTCEGLWFGQGNYVSGQYQQSSWQTNGLTIQGKSTGTTYPNVIRFNSQVDSSTSDTISISLVSTIRVATGAQPNGQQINMWALASTLKSVYPSIVL